MANWTGPFHLPKFTKEEFEEKKRKYNEKYGYTVTVPALGDIIHLNPFPPMTERETEIWACKGRTFTPPVLDVPEETKADWIKTRELPEPYYKTVTVAKILDGDTFSIEGDDRTIRLYGIDSPETQYSRIKTGQPHGEAAKAELKKHLSPGDTIKIFVRDVNKSFKDGVKTYERLVAEPISKKGENISHMMVKSGYAEAYVDFIQSETEKKLFDRLQDTAKTAKAGVWSGDGEYESPSTYRKRVQSKVEMAAARAEWRESIRAEIPVKRREEIRKEKARKKAKFLAMMGSPSPKITRSAGAILTALDDLQDAVSTLACIGLITAAVVGGTTAALLTGPLGWLVGASAALNLLNPFSRLKGRKGRPYTGRKGKKDWEAWCEKNPFSKTARARVAKNIKNFKPGTGNIVEALQVTDNVFGVGLSLGPIVGFAQDLLFGDLRKLTGQKVKIELAHGFFPSHKDHAEDVMRAAACLHGLEWESDFMDETYSFIAVNLAMQVLEPYLKEYNPMAEVADLAMYEIRAPRPTDILVREVIEEAGYTLNEVCNWPQNGEEWITYGELAEKTAPQATANLRHYAEEHKNSPLAFIAGQNAHDFALHSLAVWEGEEQVEIEYLPSGRVAIIVMDNGWCYPDDIRMDQVHKFEDWVSVHEYMRTVPSAKEIWRYAEMFCDFRWATSEDEYR